ncbi:hypothetical protein [Crenobacter caeni]|uniref:Uncharacterized protein n=1 Tax=Crenobacter caeni TaxID=2705474 RepID=A0A6B2KQS1_9NEIS|nr:hypothetical protein [Crenobacter caeni]NDV12257.1 hypothetical protein [Crenobacter caeni]
MLVLLAARIDRSRLLLVNGRLDGYPAFFHIDPQALALRLGQSALADPAAALAAHWAELGPALTRLVRRHGNDFTVDAAMLGA